MILRRGCAWTILAMLLSTAAHAGLFDRFSRDATQQQVLEADQAFQLTISALDAETLKAHWVIAEGYYLYRDKLRLELVGNPDITLGSIELPSGEKKDDPYFGIQQVFYGEAALTAQLKRSAESSNTIEVIAYYQGCAEIGVCYPPLSKSVTVKLPDNTNPSSAKNRDTANASAALKNDTAQAIPLANPEDAALPPEAEQDRLARLLGEQPWLAIPAFFGFGLLLAFTPCVFPMIPILSSIIAGQGAILTRRRALWLAWVYVLAMSLTYTAVGILAALLGQNLQAALQNPWIISAFSSLFVLLALSMFGFYDLQLPSALQQRLSAWSNQQRGGDYLGVAVMGLLSALIIGPCVAPPLIGVLTFIAVTGDLALGAAALFVMSLGMGAPLLLIGASAGHWLPHAGRWMERIKAIFGVLLLAVALWLMERVLPAALIMALWATLLIVTATYMGALQPTTHGAPTWRMLVKGLGIVLLTYGVLLLVGVAAGGRDPWQPLRGVNLTSNATAAPQALFRPIKTIADLQQVLGNSNGQPVLLDFYADWCVTCKELERFTFSDPALHSALRNWNVLQADVTANDAADQALLKHLGIVGPPAILFFDAQGQEQRQRRVVGFIDAPALRRHLQTLQ